MTLNLCRNILNQAGSYRVAWVFPLFSRLKYFKLCLWLSLITFIILTTVFLLDIRYEPFREFHDQEKPVKQLFGQGIFPRKSNVEKKSEVYQETKLRAERHQNEGNENRRNISKHNLSMMKLNKQCLSWCEIIKQNTTGRDHFFLSAVLFMRIYSSDLAKLSTRELIQWIYYLVYAGVEHVYVYDAYFQFKNESQKNALQFLINKGFITYVDWSHHANPYSITWTLVKAYQDCIDKSGGKSTWQLRVDMDEYPFSPLDTKPHFLRRYLTDLSRKRPEVSEILMHNFIFLGKPLDDSQHPLLIDRFYRRTHEPANHLVKPIYKPAHVGNAGIHSSFMKKGKSRYAEVNKLRMNNYCGGRLQHWGEDTPKKLIATREDYTMKETVKNLINCDHICLPNESLISSFRWN